jgi:chromosome segregation and condensation protein ScpB
MFGKKLPQHTEATKMKTIKEIRLGYRGPKSNLKYIMENQGVTILALAEKTKLSDRLIKRARTEQIRKCTLETLGIIADGLGVKTKDLFEE